MFALAALDEIPTTVNLKCDPDLALELRDRYEQVRPGYHMNKKHWNTVEIGTGIPDAEMQKDDRSLLRTGRAESAESYAQSSAATDDRRDLQLQSVARDVEKIIGRIGQRDAQISRNGPMASTSDCRSNKFRTAVAQFCAESTSLISRPGRAPIAPASSG